jgi:hypothetical protein
MEGRVVGTEVREDSDPNLVSAGTVRSRWVDRLDHRLVNALTVIGFGFPVAAVFWLIAHYGVNVISGDQWADVTVIQKSYTNFFDWGSLWAQHNENRIFFPNLVVVALSRTTHFNVHAEEYLAALMLIAATVLVIVTHKRRSPDTPWLYYCPVAILMLSICQYGNMLWGFQMAWYLVLVSMAVAFYLVDRISLTWLAFVGAAIAAVIGSLSSLQGLLIWPAGLVLIYHRRRAWKYVAPWLIAGAATTALYFHNFNSDKTVGPHNAVLINLVGTAKFYTFALGDILGVPVPGYGHAGNSWVLLFGLLIIVLAVLVVVVYGIRRQETSGSPLGVALICMGLLFAATVTEGRVIFGYWAAAASRYTTMDLLVPVGIYLALLDRPPPPSQVLLWVRSRYRGARVDQAVTSGEPIPVQWIGLRVARFAIAALIVIQFAFAFPNGIRGARSNYTYQARGAVVLRTIDQQPDQNVTYFLNVFGNPYVLRQQARTLQQHHLSVFANGGPGS